jgi:transcriptional regulator with XRE-family HTH domain
MLSQSQRQAASAIARGLSLKEIADSLGIAVRTLQRWRDSPEFAAQVEEFERKITDEVNQAVQTEANETAIAATRVPGLLNKALNRIEEILDSSDSRPTDVLRACQLIGKWGGLESDFNLSLTTLRKYGLTLYRDEAGVWQVEDERQRMTMS